MTKTKLFIEAVPLVDTQISGIPHALAGLVAALAANQNIQERFEIVLVAPRNRLHLLDRWRGLERCTRKAIPMKFRVMNGLGRRGLLPPMDLLLGRGVYLFGNFFNWPLTKRSRSLTYIHDICFALHPEYVQPDNQKMLLRNVPRFISQTDYVITVSESARKDIAEYFHAQLERILVLYNGVDTSLYKPYALADIAAVCRKYGLDDKPYFLFVGNIEPRKNLERLLKAFKHLPKEYALIMIGSDGWLNQKVFAMIDALNQSGRTIIKPKAYVPDEDVARLMSGAIALIQPSLYEGFGMPPLEALVSKTPVVVADIPPLREVAGEAGIYCDPLMVDSIVAGLEQALNLSPDERIKKQEIGFAHAQRFTWETTASKLAQTLETLIP